MKVVEERTPHGVVAEDRVDEAHERSGGFGHDRDAAGVRLAQPVAPDRGPVGYYVAVEVGIGVGAPVVAAPAVGMERSDRVGIGRAGPPEPQRARVVRHRH